MIDVSDLSLRELAAVVGLCGARAVAQHTGLPVGLLLAINPRAGQVRRRHRNACPTCGQPRDPRSGGPCAGCRADRRNDRVDRARTLLDAGLSGPLACDALAAREGISPLTARRAIAAARQPERAA